MNKKTFISKHMWEFLATGFVIVALAILLTPPLINANFIGSYQRSENFSNGAFDSFVLHPNNSVSFTINDEKFNGTWFVSKNKTSTDYCIRYDGRQYQLRVVEKGILENIYGDKEIYIKQ